MKKLMRVGFVMVVCLCSVVAVAAEKEKKAKQVPVSGAEVGAWSQDYAAVQKLAKEKNLPILLNFTGSDWCGWCKLMDKNVFSTDEWKKYAKDQLTLAWIDFPQNKKLVPKEFVERNKKLSEKFGVRGYPTYILLAADGETKLGQFSASRDATPEKFIADLKKAVELPAKIAALTGEKKAAYEKAKEEHDAAEKALEKWIEEQRKKQQELQKEFQRLSDKVKEASEKMEKVLE